MKSVQFANVEEQYRKYAGELRAADVQKLREWVSSQPHLPPVTELELILFLHSNYYDLEAAQRTIECYYSFRSSCKNLFGNRNLEANPIQTAMDVLDLSILPELTPEGYRVMLAKIVDPDASKFSLSSILTFAIMCVDIQLWEEGCNNGSVLIIDMDGIHLGHLPKLGIFTLKDLLYFIQEGLPIRLKGLHLANVVPFIDRIMTMIRPFMKKELLEMFHLHTSMQTLYPHIPQHLLPVDYGGTARPRKALRDDLYNHTVECGTFLAKYDMLKRVDESKRIVKPRTMGNLFGLF
ncbi:alpha-tocopherol transfer protein-like [Anopheles stephensi]|uniref:alpha-tocopherol transfer protein-like n=1 Tax=Anopheles stephensi TaxID=30069 RepID=UPI00165882F0|nr:alpha-tocopherol transfer protein-like [Anopheles stephensi]